MTIVNILFAAAPSWRLHQVWGPLAWGVGLDSAGGQQQQQSWSGTSSWLSKPCHNPWFFPLRAGCFIFPKKKILTILFLYKGELPADLLRVQLLVADHASWGFGRRRRRWSWRPQCWRARLCRQLRFLAPAASSCPDAGAANCRQSPHFPSFHDNSSSDKSLSPFPVKREQFCRWKPQTFHRHPHSVPPTTRTGHRTTRRRTWAGWSSSTRTQAWHNHPTTALTMGWPRTPGLDPHPPWPLTTWSLQWENTQNTPTSIRLAFDLRLLHSFSFFFFFYHRACFLGTGTLPAVQPTSGASAGDGEPPVPCPASLQTGPPCPILSSSHLFWGPISPAVQWSWFRVPCKIGALVSQPAPCLNLSYPRTPIPDLWARGPESLRKNKKQM